jgi:hypothetical protein
MELSGLIMRNVISIILVSSILFLNGAIVCAGDEGLDMQIEMIPWESVNELLPKNSNFTVLDVETGKRFNVQRRAGSQHADVQPLTSKDTKIMKEIYEGEWSWRRKAIIVIYDDKWIAASMHGMPHGAGKIDNGFPGHFCIHFYDSKTHRSNHMDLSHKLMTLKAAGKLQSYVANSRPDELTGIFIAGIKQQDPWMLSLISLQEIDWKNKIRTIENITLDDLSSVEINDELSLAIPVEIEWMDSQIGKQHFLGDVFLFRSFPTDTWKIDSNRFLKNLLEDQDTKKETVS